jgi:hypothetical protein
MAWRVIDPRENRPKDAPMAHSQALRAKLVLVAVEIALFAIAALTAYLSGTNQWRSFYVISAVAVVLFAATRIIDARPRLAELAFLEDAAARIARSAIAYGIDRFYNMQTLQDQHARNVDTISAIREATAMSLCANSGASYLDPGVYRHWSAVEARLRDGVPFKVVLLDPFSPEKQFRDRLNVGEDAQDSKLSVSNLVRLYNEYRSLEIRFARHGMHVTTFTTQSLMFFDPYHAGVVAQRIENRSFCLRICRASPPHALGYYDLFREHFGSLWRTSIDFEDWLDANAGLLPPSVDTVQRRHQRADAIG